VPTNSATYFFMALLPFFERKSYGKPTIRL
jgi:hypothetical protein